MSGRQRFFAPTALLAALVFVLALAFAPGGSAATGLRCAQTGVESVTTDQPSYIPGSLVRMTGAGFAPRCDVVVKVTRPDGLVVTGDGSNTPGSDTVTTDLFGGFSYDYQLQSIPAISGTYVVDALGEADTVLAHTTFEDAPKIDADIAPAYDSGSQTTTFSTLVRNSYGTSTDVMRNVKITLPSGYTNISVGSTAFSNGTWNAPVVNQVNRTVQVSTTSDAAGNALPMGGWARIDVTATTPASLSGNSAKWQFDTWSNSAGTSSNASDQPAVLVGGTTTPSAAVSFRDAGGNVVSPALRNGVSTTLRLRVTQSGGTNQIHAQYVAVALPTCFSSPTAVATSVSSGGTGGYTVNVDDNFIRLSGGAIPNTGFLTVQFDTTPSCADGVFKFPVAPNTNQNNPASTTNQVVAITGAQTTVTTDSTPPTVTINQAVGQNDPTKTSPVNFTATFSEPVTGFTGSDVTVTGTAGGTKTVTMTGGPTVYNVAVSGMTTDGTVVANVPAGGAQDAAGNNSTASTSTDATVTYDTTGPVTSSVAVNATPTNAPPTVTATETDPLNNVAAAEYFIDSTGANGTGTALSAGDGSFNSGAENVTGTLTAAQFNALSQGTHTIFVHGKDNVESGNWGGFQSVTFVKDTVKPDVTINQAAGQADPTTVAPIHYTAVFSEPVSGFASSDVSVSGTAGGTKTVAVTEVAPHDGTTYDVAVSGMTQRGSVVASLPANGAQDAAGNGNNASSSTDSTVTWDRVPSTGVTFSDHSPRTNDVVTATATPSDPDGDGVTLTYVWKVNGTTKQTTVTPSTIDTFNLGSAGFGDKSDVVTVTVTPNDALFDGSSATDSATVANTPPSVTLSAANDATVNEGTTHTYGYSISDADGDAIASVSTSCGANGSKSNASNTNSSGSFDCTFADGPASSTVSGQATDSGFGAGAGNTATQTVTVNNVAPTVAFTSAPASADEGQTKHYVYSISDPGQDTVSSVASSCGGNGTKSNAANTDAGGSFDCTFPDGPASSTVSVQATDSDGDSGNTDSQAVSVANVAPSVTIAGPAHVDEGTTHTYTFTVSDPGQDTFTVDSGYPSCGSGGSYVAGSLMTGASGGSFDCSFPDGPATTDVKIKVTDSDGASDVDSEAVQVVQVANVAPSVTPPSAQSADEGAAHGFDLGSFSDPGPDSPWTVSVAWGDGSAPTSFTLTATGSLGTQTHTYADGPDTHMVTVTVTDKNGDSGSANFQVTVDNVAPSVTLDGGNDLSVDESTAATHTYSYVVSDPAGANDPITVDSTSCGANGTKSDPTFDSSTNRGSFKCTFPDGDAGSNVSVSVDDGDGGTGSDSQTIAIHNVAPTVTLSGPSAADEGQTKTYSYTTSDPGDEFFTRDAQTCGANGTLSNASFNPVDGSGSFDCTFLDGHSSSGVSVTVSDGDGGSDSDAVTVEVSNVAPSTPSLLSPADDTKTNDATPSFDWSDSTDPAGANDTVTYSIQADNSGCGFASPEVDVSGLSSSDFTPGSGLADGTYCWRVKASDEDGGVGAYSSTRTVTIDTVRPNSAIAFPANNGSYQSPAFEAGCGTVAGDICGTASDDNSGVAKVEISIRQDSTGYYWNGSAFVAGSETFVLASGTTSWSYNVPAPPEGSYTVRSRATDNAGNVETTLDVAHFNEVAFVLDNTPPAKPSPTSTTPGSPANENDPHVNGTAEAGSSVTLYTDASCTSPVAGTGTADGTGHFDIAVHVADDSTTTVYATATDSAGNVSICSSDSVTYVEDSTRPSMTIDQAAGQNDPTNPATIHFTAVFSEPVSGFNGADVALSGTAGATTATVTDSGDHKTYDVTVSGMTSDGTVVASVPAGGATDSVGNPNTASTSTDNVVTYDTTKPSATVDQAATQSDPTNSSPIHFTVHFSETVTDFGSGDVVLSGTAGATTSVVTGSGQDYDVAVSGMTSDGTVIASVPGGGAHDAAGNGNAAASSTDNSVTYDSSRPSVTINQAATQADPTSTAPIHFTAVFSEPVSGFGNSSVTVGGTAGGMLTAGVTQLAPNDGTTYDVKVTGMTTAGTVIASIGATKAQDAAGNQNTSSTSTDNTVTWQPAAGNTTPVVAITSPAFGSVYAKGAAAINPLTLKASFTDPDNGPWTWYVNWDDGTPNSSGTAAASGTSFQATHAYTNPGVYTINVNVKDAAGAVGTAQVWIVVYDPNGGFVTGGGWLNVAPGSYASDPTLSGRANFGFNSQYKKNANVPTGETEFNLQVGNFNFHSDAYNWLVVSGYKAQYKGTGSVNGVSGYDFTLTAYDGDITGGGGSDRFRIRITKSSNGNVVFDNRNGTPTDMDVADPQVIAGGSIVIHKA